MVNARKRFGRFVVDPLVRQLTDGSGWSVDFSIEEDDGSGVTDTIFHLPGIFPTEQSAVRAAIQVGQRTIQRGFQSS